MKSLPLATTGWLQPLDAFEHRQLAQFFAFLRIRLHESHFILLGGE